MAARGMHEMPKTSLERPGYPCARAAAAAKAVGDFGRPLHELPWLYLDSVGHEFGPVSGSTMREWLSLGRFPVGGELRVRLPEWERHFPLHRLFPDLSAAFLLPPAWPDFYTDGTDLGNGDEGRCLEPAPRSSQASSHTGVPVAPPGVAGARLLPNGLGLGGAVATAHHVTTATSLQSGAGRIEAPRPSMGDPGGAVPPEGVRGGVYHRVVGGGHSQGAGGSAARVPGDDLPRSAFLRLQVCAAPPPLAAATVHGRTASPAPLQTRFVLEKLLEEKLSSPRCPDYLPPFAAAVVSARQRLAAQCQ
mmetsp:Transcript_95326/g.296808  ORF Transcript_95326/g.296808 Transcript_95326/m.296808 type:complete len:305 (-) Transcript_95326:103-1017(-)